MGGCGCKMWSLALREAHKLRVVKNGVLSKISMSRGML